MNKKSKYYFILSKFILVFIITFIIVALIRVAVIYQYIDSNLFSAIITVLRVINTVLIIALIVVALYLLVQTYNYRSSMFYQDYRIKTVEAMFHGILDMYVVYDKVKKIADAKSIKVDFSSNIVTFSKKGKYYSILFDDLFGKIDGKEGSDYWYSLSKPQKKYGRTVYANSIRFANPILVNQKFAAELKKETGNEYKDYVVLTGFYQLEFSDKKLISSYEILSLVD